MKLWLAKLELKLRWWLANLTDIRPFLRIDPNAYCPACGHRKGKIRSVTDGKVCIVRHVCAICNWMWDEETVTDIEQIVSMQPDDEDEPPQPGELVVNGQVTKK